MKPNRLNLNNASKFTFVRVRPVLLVLSLVLVGYAVAGTSPASAARSRTVDGSVNVSADVSSVAPGGVINYTITVQNGDQAGLVTVSNNLPAHTTLLDAPGCTADGNGGGVSCVLAMFPFDVAVINVSVSVDDSVNCSNTLRDRAHIQGWPSSTADVDVTCAP